MIPRFGPAGNADSFYAAGFKSSLQAPAWLQSLGLNAYEYSFGRGVSLGAETAGKIAAEARARDIAVSAHAPYFINLANPDPEKREASFRYITESAAAVTALGGDRVVVHVGADLKQPRAEALARCRDGLREAYLRLADLGLGRVHLCPETMGRRSQIGDLQEILDLCLLDARLIPCIDFAHLHALGGGEGQEDLGAGQGVPGPEGIGHPADRLVDLARLGERIEPGHADRAGVGGEQRGQHRCQELSVERLKLRLFRLNQSDTPFPRWFG